MILKGHKIILFATGLSVLMAAAAIVIPVLVFSDEPAVAWDGPVSYACPNDFGEVAAYEVQLAAYNRTKQPSSVCTSAPNACGATTVVQQSCSLVEGNGETPTLEWSCPVCSVVASPATPSGYGSACTVINSCGNSTNTGTIQCDGSCSATQPSEALCPSSTQDTTTTGIPQNVSTDQTTTVITPTTFITAHNLPEIQVTSQPILTRKGGQVVINWNQTTNLELIQSCTLNSSSGESWLGKQGLQSVLISEETKFTLTCSNINNDIMTDDVTVRVIPAWQEF